MSKAIICNIESVRTRASTQEALLTLAVPIEQGALIAGFMAKVGQQVGVAFADVENPTVKDSLMVEKPKGGPLSHLAGIWSKDMQFWTWLTIAGHQCTSEEEARDIICSQCGISSRAELDHNGRAKSIFEGRFRLPYANYLERMRR